MSTVHGSPVRTSRSRPLQALAQALSAAIAVAYLVLFFLVRAAERDEPENTFGAYVLLFVAYVGCTVALSVWRGPVVALAAAALQVAVLALFVVFGVGLLGPGLFDYAAVRSLHMPLWATGVALAQVVLLGVLVRLVVAGRPR
ncbi:MAG: hypothetical protein ACTHN8_18370 [Angustibacter sp.]